DEKFLDQSEGDARFLNGGEKAVDADAVDGIDSSDLAQKLDNVVTVSSSGGDFTSIQAAVDSVTDASGSNPYLVLVGPGTYTGQVTLTSGVSLQGSGRLATVVTAPGAQDCSSAYTIKSGTLSTVSDLFVVNSGGAECAIGILNSSAASSFRDLTINVDGGTTTMVGLRHTFGSTIALEDMLISVGGTANGMAMGIEQIGASVLLMNLDIRAFSSQNKAIGVRNEGSSLVARDSVIRGISSPSDTIGILNENASSDQVLVHHSVVFGVTDTISNGPSYVTRVASSQLDGGDPTNSGTLVCAGVYDENFTFSASTCP
ncbi:MAG: hypothetical protein ACRDHB_04350, partial [Actinomycetota bacterium]